MNPEPLGHVASTAGIETWPPTVNHPRPSPRAICAAFAQVRPSGGTPEPSGGITKTDHPREMTTMTDAVDFETYNISRASTLSGVPTETIRIWERRYQLLNPSRSAGGHRQYNLQEVELLRALRVLVARGERIGALAKRPPSELLAEAEELLAHAAPADASAEDEREPETAPSAADPNTAWIQAVVNAGKAFDFPTIETLFDQALDDKDAQKVVQELFVPLLAEAGRRWLDRTLPVEAEHLLGHLVFERIHAIRNARPAPPPSAPKVVCACVPGDLHELGLLTATLVLDERGTKVTYLGSNLPLHSLAHALEEISPKLLVLSATLPPSQKTLAGLEGAFKNGLFDDIHIVCGGAGASAVSEALGGRPVVVGDAEEFARRVDELLG